MRIGTPSKLAAAMGIAALVAAGPAAAQTSAYKTPAAGAWKVQDIFERTAGGSATIAKGGKRLTKLTANVGPRSAGESVCGETKRVALATSMPIKRVGTSQRPAVGRLGKDKVITTVKAKLKVDGQTVDGKVMVIFEKTGRQAFTVKLEAGSCLLSFAIRK